MTDIFLSYTHEDETRIRELVRALEEHGFSIFWDREIPTGRTWQNYIGQALADAKCVMVAWSHRSITSDWVIEEANNAKKRGLLMPILLDPVDPPLGFGGIQAANLTDWKRGSSSPHFDKLIQDITGVVGGKARQLTLEEELTPRAGPTEPPPREPTPPKPAPPPSPQPETKTSAVPIRQRRRLTMIGSGIAALLVAIIAGWFLFKPGPPAAPPATTVTPGTKAGVAPPVTPEAKKEETPAAKVAPQPKEIAPPKRQVQPKAPGPPKLVLAEETADECFARAEQYDREKNFEQAAAWYRKAADQGHAEAAYRLGLFYLNGRGVPRDDKAAFTWMLKAAEKGFVRAYGTLGYCYAEGRGTAQNYNEAAQWYRKAADQGDMGAQFRLGGMYLNGQGVPRDPAQGIGWYKKAAEQRFLPAQLQLGQLYEKGTPGVARDIAEARKWYRMAAQQGNKSAQDALARLEGSAGAAKDADTARKPGGPGPPHLGKYRTPAEGRLSYYDFDTRAQLDRKTPSADFFFEPASSAQDSLINVSPLNGAKFAPSAPNRSPWDVPSDRFISTFQSVPQRTEIPCVTNGGRRCFFDLQRTETGDLSIVFGVWDSR